MCNDQIKVINLSPNMFFLPIIENTIKILKTEQKVTLELSLG